MEPFLIYVIVCIASAAECKDMMPGKPWFFKGQRECIEFAGKLLNAYREDARNRNLILVDGTAFCLRFKEVKKI